MALTFEPPARKTELVGPVHEPLSMLLSGHQGCYQSKDRCTKLRCRWLHQLHHTPNEKGEQSSESIVHDRNTQTSILQPGSGRISWDITVQPLEMDDICWSSSLDPTVDMCPIYAGDVEMDFHF